MAIISFVGFCACQDIENCDANDEQRFMVVRFLEKESGQPKEANFSITDSGSPIEFLILEDLTGVALPLNPNSETATFFFDSLETNVHFELEMGYKTQVSVFDEACDPSFTFINLDTVRYTFDSLSIPGRITNRQIETNVQVFF